MSTIKIADEAWRKIYKFLQTHPNVYAGQEDACRCFVEGVQWMLRSGAQWRELPERYGNWNSVYKRFSGWEERGIWSALHEHFAQDPDMESVLIDSTVIRAHMCAAGGSKKNGRQEQQALGRSRGGFSTKVHILVDALGLPLRLMLTGGQRHDITQADALIDSLQFDHVIADKGYDADAFLETIAEQEATAVIPSRQSRVEQRDYDKHLYKERQLVECFINKIKWFRRIFARYDKLARRYTAFLHLASTLIWLR